MSHFTVDNRTTELPVAKELPVVNYQLRRREWKWEGERERKEEEEEEEAAAALAQVLDQIFSSEPPDFFCTLNY